MQKIRSNRLKQCEARLVPTSFHADCGSEPLSSGTDAFLWAQSVTECCNILQSITRYWKVLQRSEPLSPGPAKMRFSGILPPTPALAISPLQTFTRQQLEYCKIIWMWPAQCTLGRKSFSIAILMAAAAPSLSIKLWHSSEPPSAKAVPAQRLLNPKRAEIGFRIL